MHHGMVIHHDFEDLFLQKKSAKNDSSKFFKFISPTINTSVQHVLQDMSDPISFRTLEDLFYRSKPMNYKSIVYVYGWMMEKY